MSSDKKETPMKLSLQGLVGYLQGKGWKIHLNEKADDEEEVFEVEDNPDEEGKEGAPPEEDMMKKKKMPMKANAEAEEDADPMVTNEELEGLRRLAQVFAKNSKLLEAIEAGTLESALTTVPAAAQLVKNAADREKAEKDQLIAVIKQNSSNIYSDEELASMTNPVLTKLNSQMNVSYAGLGGAFIQNAEEPLLLPQGLLAQAKEVSSNGS